MSGSAIQTENIRATWLASKEGRVHFGQVVAALIEAQVEAYFVDYRGHRVTYYLPMDQTLSIDYEADHDPIGTSFSAEGLVEVIRAAQRGEVMYPEFVKQSKRTGCVGYFVWIAGRHVTYLGRHGEQHVERFPD